MSASREPNFADRDAAASTPPGPANDAGRGAGGGGAEPHRTDPASDRIAPTDLFLKCLRDAEELLSFAAQTGRFPLEEPGNREGLKQWVIDGVTNARVAVENDSLTKGIANAFWACFADLSRITRPVTAATLRTPERRGFGFLDLFVILLVLMLLPASLFLFVNSSVANQVSQLITEQNSSALTLWSQVQYSRNAANTLNPPAAGAGPASAEDRSVAAQSRAYAVAAQPGGGGVARLTPEELFAQVVDFSRKNHWLRETAVRLNTFIGLRGLVIDETPINFEAGNHEGLTELNVSPKISTLAEIHKAAIRQILMYQHIRNFAQAVLKTDSILYSGITTYLLPALYALLGAALYGLRNYAKMVQLRAYSRSSASTARYFIALIAGTVIGLFGSLLPQNLSLPPLAVAFLVGYAVEAFFSRLDGAIAKITADDAVSPPSSAELQAARAARPA